MIHTLAIALANTTSKFFIGLTDHTQFQAISRSQKLLEPLRQKPFAKKTIVVPDVVVVFLDLEASGLSIITDNIFETGVVDEYGATRTLPFWKTEPPNAKLEPPNAKLEPIERETRAFERETGASERETGASERETRASERETGASERGIRAFERNT